MYNLKLRCPSCFNETGFTVTALDSYTTVGEKFLAGQTYRIVHAYCLAKCSNCGQPVLAKIETTLQGYEHIKQAIEIFQYVPTLRYIKILEYLPKPPEPYVHESFPEKVRELFKDLQEILWSKKHPSIIVGGCRSVLEASLNALNAQGKTIKEKIDDLLKKGQITRVLADWAHHIRLEGNEAIHEIEATSEEAYEIVEFTKIFLNYVFELPFRIELIKSKKS